MIKKITTWFLIPFVVTAVAAKIVLLNMPQEPPVIPDGNILVFCHATVRCPTCETMESLIKEVLEKPENTALGIDLITLEYDSPANHDFAEQFRVGTAGIILLEKKEGNIARSSNITLDAWKYVEDKKSFIEMLETKLSEFY